MRKTDSQQLWILEGGTTTLSLDPAVMTTHGLRVIPADDPKASSSGSWMWSPAFAIDPGSELVGDVSGQGIDIIGGSIRHIGGLTLAGPRLRRSLNELVITPVAGSSPGDFLATDGRRPGGEGFVLHAAQVRIDPARNTLVITTAEVSLSPALAKALGKPELAGIPIGEALVQAGLERVDGEGPTGASGASPSADQPVAGGGVIGPDVIVISLPSVRDYGSEVDPQTGEYISAFAVGTTSCNIGDEPAVWDAHTNQHPVIAQNMYRLKNDRFEQIGMSWVKHGFYAVIGSQCGQCIPPPVIGEMLGVNCSDPYGAPLNGAQYSLGPRFQVNAHTGYFPYPPPRPPSTVIGGRLQVHNADLDPQANSGAQYFVDGHYVTPDDAAAGNGNNNASYAPARITRLGGTCDDTNVCVGDIHDGEPCETDHDCLGNTFSASVTGTTQRQQAAIRAWQDRDPSVEVTDIRIPGEGLFILAAKTIDLGTGYWRYEYALQNLTSDRSGGSFELLLPEAAIVQNIGFHDVDYHTGEPYDLTDWPATVSPGVITWSTTAYEVDPDANALRWGTLYNFRFETNVGPEATTATLGLFKPDTENPEAVNEVEVATVGPAAGRVDCNNNGIADECDIDCGTPGGPCDVEGCGQSLDVDPEDGVPDECEGACCGPAGCIRTTEAACGAFGTYRGDGTTCEEEACAGIPTVSGWGIVAMTLLVLTAGTVVLMRRRRSAT